MSHGKPNSPLGYEAAFCIEAVKEALAKHRTPELQLGPGQVVHQHALTDNLKKERDCHQHGRKGAWQDDMFVAGSS